MCAASSSSIPTPQYSFLSTCYSPISKLLPPTCAHSQQCKLCNASITCTTPGLSLLIGKCASTFTFDIIYCYARTSWKACITIPTHIPLWLNQLHLPSPRAQIFHHYHTPSHNTSHSSALGFPLPHTSRWHLLASQPNPGKPPLGDLLKMQFATVLSKRLLTHGEGMSHDQFLSPQIMYNLLRVYSVHVVYVKNESHPVRVQDVFLPIPAFISCAGVTGGGRIRCHANVHTCTSVHVHVMCGHVLAVVVMATCEQKTPANYDLF